MTHSVMLWCQQVDLKESLQIIKIFVHGRRQIRRVMKSDVSSLYNPPHEAACCHISRQTFDLYFINWSAPTVHLMTRARVHISGPMAVTTKEAPASRAAMVGSMMTKTKPTQNTLSQWAVMVVVAMTMTMTMTSVAMSAATTATSLLVTLFLWSRDWNTTHSRRDCDGHFWMTQQHMGLHRSRLHTLAGGSDNRSHKIGGSGHTSQAGVRA
jgi:hypothetical protein